MIDIASGGTSIWLDDLSRSKISGTDSHSLPQRIALCGVVGVTTNPSIFNAAISKGSEYSADIASMRGQSSEEIVKKLTTDDVRQACDLFLPIYTQSQGIDGRVSIEVDPRSAHQTQVTVAEGLELWKIVDRPNVMIKVPATLEGLPAITALIAEGVSVNVTLIFSAERYGQVVDAFMTGLEARLAAGKEIANVTSVASLFVSRIDTAIDALIKSHESPTAKNLLGKAAIANAVLAYELYEGKLDSQRWRELQSQGARMQRLLWASTGVKDPDYLDTRYVVELVAPNTVNTMPQATLDALVDHGSLHPVELTTRYSEAAETIASLSKLGISLPVITHELEVDGVLKFEQAWNELLANVEKAASS